MQSKINEMLQEESSPESSSTEDDDEIDANNGKCMHYWELTKILCMHRCVSSYIFMCFNSLLMCLSLDIIVYILLS